MSDRGRPRKDETPEQKAAREARTAANIKATNARLNAYYGQIRKEEKAKEAAVKLAAEKAKAEEASAKAAKQAARMTKEAVEQYEIVNEVPKGAKVAKNKKGESPVPVDDFVVANIVHQTFELLKQDKCTDAELPYRLEWYFNEYAANGILPTAEGLALACGVERQTFDGWARGVGCSPARQRMVQKAKQALAEVDAQLAMHGKVNPVLYIFRSKNFHGMKDQSETVVTHQVAEKTIEELMDEAVLLPDEEV